MTRIYVKPAPIDPAEPDKGVKSIPSPSHGGAPLPAVGAWVDAGLYWDRRFVDGDVTGDTKAQAEAEAAAEKRAAEEGKKAAKAASSKTGDV